LGSFFLQGAQGAGDDHLIIARNIFAPFIVA
jgi:hypothetical protein